MAENRKEENALLQKWGEGLFNDGITNIPECVARFGIRFITAGELAFVLNVLSYRYTSDMPFPKQETLAKNMGVSVRQVRKYQKGLEDKGMIEVYERYNHEGRTSNVYDFTPLANLCLELSRSLKNENEKIVKMVKKRDKKEVPEQIVPIPKVEVVPEQFVPIPPELEVPGPPELEVQGPPELEVPRNKESEERSLRKKENKVCVIPEEEKRIIDLISTREDLKTHTKGIIKILNAKKKNKSFKYDVFEKTLEIIDLDIKPFKYLETALMNNLKKGYVEDYKTPPQIEQKDPALFPYGSKQVMPLPKWYKDINKSAEEWQAEQEQDDIDFAAERQRILAKAGYK